MTTNQDRTNWTGSDWAAFGYDSAAARPGMFEAAHTDDTVVVATVYRVGNVGSKADHALDSTGHTLCGAERHANRYGVGFVKANATGETTDVRKITCKRCRAALDARR